MAGIAWCNGRKYTRMHPMKLSRFTRHSRRYCRGWVNEKMGVDFME